MVKRELRIQAEELRRQGWSVPAIAAELKVARSTAFQWTRHLPREGNEAAVARRKAHSKAMTDARWAEHRIEREADRAAILASAAAGVGQLPIASCCSSGQPSTGPRTRKPSPGDLMNGA